MRLFFGIPIDGVTRERTAAVLTQLRERAGKVKWVEPENLHITLRYIGEVASGDVEAVAEAAEGCWREAVGGKLAVRGMGAFPNVRQPRVIWVGLGEGRELACRLHEALSDRLEAKLNMERERRRFSPHLTIGRVKAPPGGGDITRAIKELADVDLGAFHCSRFVLYQSELTPQGPIYSAIRTYDAQYPA